MIAIVVRKNMFTIIQKIYVGLFHFGILNMFSRNLSNLDIYGIKSKNSSDRTSMTRMKKRSHAANCSLKKIILNSLFL